MSIHKTSRGNWEVRWRQGSRNRSRTFDLKSDARTFDSEVRRTLQMGGSVPRRVGSTTLGQFAEIWFRQKSPGLEQKTAREYSAQFDRHVDPFLGHVPLNHLRPMMLNEWQQERFSSGAGVESVAKATQVLSQILDRAVAMELIPQNPALTLEQPKYSRVTKTSATVEQVEEIRTQMDLGTDCLVSFLAYVGPRPMEALALTWEDIDGDRAAVTKALTDGNVKVTKTHRNRGVVLPRNVVHDLRVWKLASGHSTGLIWRRRIDGAPWRQHDWDHWRARNFKPVAESIGMVGFTPAELRHTAATLWIAAGRPVNEVAAQLGNSAVVVLSRYQHLLDLYHGRKTLEIDQRIDQVRAPTKRESA